jgi:hypothetical protein
MLLRMSVIERLVKPRLLVRGKTGVLFFFAPYEYPPPARHGRRLAAPSFEAFREPHQQAQRMIAKFRLFAGRFTKLAAALAALALALAAHPRVALAKAKTIAVLLEGADAESLRGAITNAVPHGTGVAEPDAMRTALAAQGVHLPMGRALEGAQREKTLARVRKAAAAAGVDGTLVARVTKSKRERHVLLILVATSGAAGDLEDDVVLGMRPSKEDEGKVASSVGTALVDYRSAPGDSDKTTPPAKEAKEKEEEEPAAETAHAAPPSNGGETGPDTAEGGGFHHPHGVPGRELFDLALGAGVVGRHFGYSVDSSSTLNLRPYSVFPAAMVSVEGEIYPLADSPTAILRDFGLIGAYSRSLFLQSSVDRSNVDTTASAYYGGLRWRVMPAGEAGLRLGISVSYASQSFGFDASTSTGLPAVSYHAVRPAVDLRVPIGPVSLLAQVGYRLVLSAGDVALRFSGTTTTGFDIQGGAAITIARGWEVRALADYTGYFYSFNSQQTDAYRAKSAVEHFYGGRLALAAIF